MIQALLILIPYYVIGYAISIIILPNGREEPIVKKFLVSTFWFIAPIGVLLKANWDEFMKVEESSE